MNLLDVLLEMISNLSVKVKDGSKIIDISTKEYYKYRNCTIVECCKSNINGVNYLTLYLDYMEYCLYNNISEKNNIKLEPINDYGFDDYYGGK